MKDRFRKLFSNVWTIPNILTMIRLFLIPVFVVVFFSTPHDRNKIAALVIFAAASITDMFDGMLARKLNQNLAQPDTALVLQTGIQCK